MQEMKDLGITLPEEPPAKAGLYAQAKEFGP